MRELGGSIGGRGFGVPSGQLGRVLLWGCVLAATGVLATLVMGASAAVAEPFCTDSWESSSGAWNEASRWSAKHVPTSTEVACIGAGKTVIVSEEGAKAGAVEVEGALRVVGGSLELASALEVSSVASLTLKKGTLSGVGSVDVTASLAWEEGGTMSGSAKTTVAKGASASITEEAGCPQAHLVERTLVNEGTATLGGASTSSGVLTMSEGARIENSGVFSDNSESTCRSSRETIVAEAGKVAPVLVNTGTLERSEDSGSFTPTIGVEVNNTGTIDGRSGALGFKGALVTLAAASVLEGPLDFAGGSVSTGSITVTKASIAMSAGTSLQLGTGATASFNNLSLEDANVTGPGNLDLTGSLGWEEGTMSGSGKTVIEHAASASILTGSSERCRGVELDERTLVNEGTVTLGRRGAPAGSLAMSEGAKIETSSVFYDNVNGYSCSPTWSTIVEGAATKAPSIVNTGLFEEAEGEAEFTRTVEVPFENKGTLRSKVGRLGFAGKAVVTLASGSVLEGEIEVKEKASVTADSVIASGASLRLTNEGTWTVAGGNTMSVNNFFLEESTLSGAGTLNIDSKLEWEPKGTMSGSGKTVLEGGAEGKILEHTGAYCIQATLEKRTFVNDGTIIFNELNRVPGVRMGLSRGALLENKGIFEDDSNGNNCTSEPSAETIVGGSAGGKIVNLGLFERVGGTEIGEPLEPKVAVPFENWGKTAGELVFLEETRQNTKAWGCSEEDPSFPKREVASEEGVCTASGDLSETQTDYSIGGRGIGLNLTRTYNSQAAEDGFKSVFGYGWTFPYSEHLTFASIEEPVEVGETGEFETVLRHTVTLVEENGNTVGFTEGAKSGEWNAPAGSPDVLTGTEATGFTLTLESGEAEKFAASSGRLESITERGGNTTAMGYTGSQLTKVTSPSGPALTFVYNGEGLIEKAYDPMLHDIEYTYENGDLVKVSQPNKESEGPRWQFKYSSETNEGKSTAQLVEMLDGRGGKTTYEYSGAHRVTHKTDPMGRGTKFEYGTVFTKITNEATGAVTEEEMTGTGQLVEVIHGVGTEHATAESFAYDSSGDKTSETNGDGFTTHYEYDSSGNKLTMEDPEGHKTKWTYNSYHEVLTEVLPDGKTTTYKRNEATGNPEKIEVSGPEATTEVTSYTYFPHGEVESMTNPLGHTWKYEYDEHGDRSAEIDPEGDKRTWGYNTDSQEASTVSPRGHEAGAKESSFTTTTERNARGLPVKIVAPLKHETLEEYDGDGNIIKKTDPEGNVTKYVYDADNELTETEEPNKDTTTTEYDGAGQVIKQTDGNGHATVYKRNVLEQVHEIIEPLERITVKTYDHAGNLESVVDAEKRTTTYKYSPDNRLTEVSYSEGKTPTVTYEYNGDGLRTKMTDGTGTTTYKYDGLDRLKLTTDGHGDTVGYEYNVANEQEKITYPNGKVVSREYDNDGRLKSVTDWAGNKTTFEYDRDSDLKATKFPSGTGDEDTYSYNEADAMSEVKMKRGSETLASLGYTRNKDEGVTKTTTTGLPGEATLSYAYDKNSRLEKGAGVKYAYDKANNVETIGSDTLTYNAADEPKEETDKKAIEATYTYNEVGERTKGTSSKHPVTTYEYNQAGDLVGVSQPKGETTAAIEDAYTYNGDGLRAAKITSTATTYLTWDVSEALPVILDDGTYSYIYGPADMPVEQILDGSTHAISYLHHDQQGSTRLLTNEEGKEAGAETYDAYGNVIDKAGATTSSLGYDGQYTEADTGLIYLRARYYDPTTAQFLEVDPEVESTGEPYGYAADSPLRGSDPTGLKPWGAKVKEAKAHCEWLKTGPSKNKKGNLFYQNRHYYEACENLLHAPSEVYGTGAGEARTTAQKAVAGISAEVAGTLAVAGGIVGGFACGAAEVATETAAHCVVGVVTVISGGLYVYLEGARSLEESGVKAEPADTDPPA